MELTDQVRITLQDIQEMLRINPLAAEQAKAIALARQNAELQAELAQLRNGKAQNEKEKA